MIKQKNIMQVNANQLKGLEFAKLTIPLFCLSVHRGYAGNSRQLHPMKAKISTIYAKKTEHDVKIVKIVNVF